MKSSFTTRTYKMYLLLTQRGAVAFYLVELRASLESKLNTRPLCPYCNCTLSLANVSLDHLLPVSRGGRNTLLNIQFVCKNCNKSKGDMTHEEYSTLLKYLDVLEAKHRNFELKKRVVDSLRVAQSFRQGAMRKAKKK